MPPFRNFVLFPPLFAAFFSPFFHKTTFLLSLESLHLPFFIFSSPLFPKLLSFALAVFVPLLLPLPPSLSFSLSRVSKRILLAIFCLFYHPFLFCMLFANIFLHLSALLLYFYEETSRTPCMYELLCRKPALDPKSHSNRTRILFVQYW